MFDVGAAGRASAPVTRFIGGARSADGGASTTPKTNSMSREEILLWMDAVADNWPWLGDRQRQLFVECWWWELFDVLKAECLDRCPAEAAMRKRNSKE